MSNEFAAPECDLIGHLMGLNLGENPPANYQILADGIEQIELLLASGDQPSDITPLIGLLRLAAIGACRGQVPDLNTNQPKNLSCS
jgi:hypothetical protein